jgi:hypothetical protein
MKKLHTLALALTLALSLAACGGTSNSGNGGNTTTTPPANSSTPGTSQGADTTPSGNSGEIVWDRDNPVKPTADNYEQLIKEIYGLDFTLPDGWEYVSGSNKNINPAYGFTFSTTASDLDAAAEELRVYLFNLTASLGNVDKNDSPITETNKQNWLYRFDKYGWVQVIVSPSSDNNVVVDFTGVSRSTLDLL